MKLLSARITVVQILHGTVVIGKMILDLINPLVHISTNLPEKVSVNPQRYVWAGMAEAPADRDDVDP